MCFCSSCAGLTLPAFGKSNLGGLIENVRVNSFPYRHGIKQLRCWHCRRSMLHSDLSVLTKFHASTWPSIKAMWYIRHLVMYLSKESEFPPASACYMLNILLFIKVPLAFLCQERIGSSSFCHQKARFFEHRNSLVYTILLQYDFGALTPESVEPVSACHLGVSTNDDDNLMCRSSRHGPLPQDPGHILEAVSKSLSWITFSF